MRASAQVTAESDGCGGTRLAVLRGESPLLPRRTGARGGRAMTVHLVGGAAGPLRGDDLRLAVEVGPDADLTVRSVAAQLALPGRPGLPPSRLEIHATVAAGGTLRWLPEPLIAAAGCDHRAVTRVEASAGSTLLWREDLVCGRHDEESGHVVVETTIRYAGRTLHRHDLSVGPAAPGWSGPAVLGGGRALGTLLLAPAESLPIPPTSSSPAASSPGMTTPPAADAAVMPLAGPGVLVTAIGTDIRQVQAVLDPLCADRTALRSPVGS